MPAQRNTKIPLSYSQEHIWIWEQMVESSSLYHIPLMFRLTQEINISALQTAFYLLMQRHEILRTNFVVDDDGHHAESQADGRGDLFRNCNERAHTEKEGQRHVLDKDRANKKA